MSLNNAGDKRILRDSHAACEVSQSVCGTTQTVENYWSEIDVSWYEYILA